MKKHLLILSILLTVFSFKVYAEGTRWSVNAEVQQELSDLIKNNALPSATSWVVDKEAFKKEQEQLKKEAIAQQEQEKASIEQEQAKEEDKKEDVAVEEQVKEPVEQESKQEVEKVATNYTHIMQKDETLYSVAKKYNANLNQILKDNNIKDPAGVKAGQRIVINNVLIEQDEPNVSEFVYYKVVKGDSLYKIAKDFSMSVDEVLAMNNIKKDEAKRKVLPGKILKLKDNERIEHYAGKDLENKDESLDKDRFDWPLVGRILKDYGASLNGTINEGINIKANQNTIVKSTEDGTVIYTGESLKAFGNLILIQHDDNWISAYAHLKSIMVKKGQKVKKGDSIGRVGSTGYVTSSQLHFELRRNAEPVDPLKFLKSYR